LYEHHTNSFGFDLQTFYTDINCPTPPTVNQIKRPTYLTDCNNTPIDCCDIIQPVMIGDISYVGPGP